MPDATEAALLNESQRRHLGITLSQVQGFLREIGAPIGSPGSRAGLVIESDDLPPAFVRDAATRIANADRLIGDLAERFALPRRESSRYRWVRSVLGISFDDLEDTLAKNLRGDGDVHPALAGALDPGLRALQGELGTLRMLLETGEEPPA